MKDILDQMSSNTAPEKICLDASHACDENEPPGTEMSEKTMGSNHVQTAVTVTPDVERSQHSEPP